MPHSTIRFARSFRLHGSILGIRLQPPSRTLRLSPRIGSGHTSRAPVTGTNTSSQPFLQGEDKNRVECSRFQGKSLGVASKVRVRHYDVQFGEVISPANGRTTYRIERKTGSGFQRVPGSIYLDMKDRFVALKILTTHATDAHNKGLSIEVEALASLAGHPNVIDAFRNFTVPSKQTPSHPEKEKHIVIATALYSGSLYDILARARERFAPLSFVKHALLQITCIRKTTYTQMDNILADNGPLTITDIDGLLTADPLRHHPPQANEPYSMKVAISQPLPIPTIEEAMSRTFCISDMGAVYWKRDLAAGLNASPINFKGPEIILGAPLDEKVDIWMFRLLLYEAVTGAMLFRRPVKLESEDPDFPVAFHLWQMCALLSTVDDFSPYLRGGIYAEKYLNSDGLISHPDTPKQQHGTLRRALNGNPPSLDPADGDAIASILQCCLKLDSRERPSAAELLEDPWWELGGNP